MNEVKLLVGRGGKFRRVIFQATLLGEYCSTEDNLLQQLYQTPSGRLIVYEEYSYNNKEFRNLVEVSPEALGPFGAYAWLGEQCGFDRVITLDEALTGRGVSA